MQIINFLLYSDQKNNILKLYHNSNKLIIPFLLPSIILKDDNKIKKYFDLLNIINLSFHSYVSFSSIITDYHKKIPYINEKLLRIINFKSHNLFFLFISYQLYLKNFNKLEYNYVDLKRRETLPENYYKEFKNDY